MAVEAMGDRPTRVLIADDHDDVRGAFRIILDAEPDLQVVAEAADGVAAIDQARTVRPDVALVDIRMPRLGGLDVTRELAGPQVPNPLPVVVVTTFDLDEYVYTALRHGACGFLLKRSSPALLVEAVRAARSGESLISPQITVRLLRHLTEPAATPVAAPSAALTDREVDVVREVAQGKTNAEIAATLYIAPGTVKNHVAAIQRKLGARNRVGVAARAWELGLA